MSAATLALKNFWAYLWRTLLVLLLVLLLFEIALRVKSWMYHQSTGQNASHTVFLEHYGYNPFLIIGPDINKKVPQAGGQTANWNGQGFRMDEELELDKTPGEYRIFALGGSTTEDLTNGQNLHYCGLANDFLKEKFPEGDIRCINAGKSAFTSAHSLIRLETDILPYKPDMITVMHNINDLTVNFYPNNGRYNYGNKYLSQTYAPALTPGAYVLHLLSGSRSVSYIVNTLHKLTLTKNVKFNPEPTKLVFEDAFQSYLISIAAVAKARGIRVVFLTEPVTFAQDKFYTAFGITNDPVLYPTPEEFQKLFEQYNDVIRQVARQTDSDLIDLEALVGHDEKYFIDVVHTNELGVRRIGELYAQNLAAIIGKNLK